MNIFTSLECDRCKSVNATRIPVGKKQIDLCGRCVVLLTSVLIRKIPEEVQESWIKSFKDGIIG